MSDQDNSKTSAQIPTMRTAAPDLTLEHAKEAKAQAERDIRAVIRDFQEKTGLPVRGINVRTIDVTTFGSGPQSVVTELTLEVKL